MKNDKKQVSFARRALAMLGLMLAYTALFIAGFCITQAFAFGTTYAIITHCRTADYHCYVPELAHNAGQAMDAAIYIVETLIKNNTIS